MAQERAYQAAVITISDSAASGSRRDTAGPAVAGLLRAAGFEVAREEILPDEETLISRRLTELADREGLNLVVTAGGTGLAPRDRTPEATLAVIDRLVPGLAELMRFEGLKKTPHAALSRAVAGSRGQCLIMNLPGSLKAARESLEAVLAALPHALDKLSGDPRPCGD